MLLVGVFQVVWVWVSREITLQMFLSSSSSSTNLDSSVFQVRKHRTVSSWLTHRVSGPGREIASSSTTNEINPEQQTIEIEFSQTSTGCRWKESGGATCALSNAAFLCFFGKWQQATVVGTTGTGSINEDSHNPIFIVTNYRLPTTFSEVIPGNRKLQ